MRLPPLLPTLIVGLAVATMIALGFWQLQRLGEKEALLARYGRVASLSSEVPWPRDSTQFERALYRRSKLDCAQVRAITARAGHSQGGETGWAHVARCVLAGGGEADVALGWSREPRSPAWSGGEVGGFIGPYGNGVKLVAAPPLAGLAQLAPPDPRDIPNNHLSYALQWFLFAATALVIYALALRGRWRGRKHAELEDDQSSPRRHPSAESEANRA